MRNVLIFLTKDCSIFYDSLIGNWKTIEKNKFELRMIYTMLLLVVPPPMSQYFSGEPTFSLTKTDEIGA
jgi:hypothetical protein